MSELFALLPEYGLAHLRLTLLALACGVVIAVPAGIAVSRRPRLEPWLLGAAGVLQTIPSLALLALMVPVLAALGALTAHYFAVELSSIGFLPAWIALTLYSVLPMLRNTVAGLAGVDPALIEAARGVGMTPAQRLWRVELPLALPVIVAGVRTASVWVVGTATLATPVGATSLGNFIFAGLQTRNFASVILGSVAAAVLALSLDGLVSAAEGGLRQRRPRRWGAGGAGLFSLFALALGTSLQPAAAGGRSIAIGAKGFTEQYVLAEILAQTIRAQSGAATRAVESLGSTVAFDALRSDELDLYFDYSGTIWATILKREGLPSDRAAVLEGVREALAEHYGIGVVATLGFENTYAFAMRSDRASELGITRIGDLARLSPRLAAGGDYEFFARAEWAALRERYGLHFREKRSMDPALMYPAVANGEVDVISAFSTDGRIRAFDLVLLEDELGVIPPYDAILLASPRLQRERPELLRSLAKLTGSIDAAAMQRMNLAVDEGGRSPASVAAEFLAAGVER
jgi:osmoprotectant transport system permease protein